MFDPGRRSGERAARVSMALLRITTAVKKVTLADSAALGLTPVQAQTLLFVRHTKSFMASMRRLAESLGTTQATAAGVVRALEERGLVARAPDERDRRVTLLRLTSSGARLCDRLEDWAGDLARSVERLDDATFDQLERGLGAVVAALRDAGLIVVSEPCRGCVHFEEDARPGAREPHRCALIDRHLSEADSRKDCPDHSPVASVAGSA